ncbi:hypothetical protein TNCV_4054101 [Trichonephila clavipes]|nr:hypothetical protein TNCV_4054101 [Trichonephila clavipes]
MANLGASGFDGYIARHEFATTRGHNFSGRVHTRGNVGWSRRLRRLLRRLRNKHPSRFLEVLYSSDESDETDDITYTRVKHLD